MINYKSILKWFLIVGIYFGMQIISTVTLYELRIENKVIINSVMLITDIVTCAILIIFYKKDFIDGNNDFNKNFKKRIKSTYFIWFIGLVIMLITNSAIQAIIKDIASNELANREVLSKYYFYAIPSMVILGPICEEIIFRLSLKKIFNNNYLFIIISALLFGGAHVLLADGLEILYIIPYGALGAAFAYLYEKTNNILCSILAHITHNLLCIILLVLL